MLEREAQEKVFHSRLSATVAVYFVTVVGSIRFGRSLDPSAGRTLLLLTPMVPVLLMVWVLIRQFGRMDEFVRLRVTRGLLGGRRNHRGPDLHLRIPRIRRLPEAEHVLGVGRSWALAGETVSCWRSPVQAMKNLVRELRTDRGWSQGDLADKLEVSRQTINAIETGKYDPSLPLAFAIAKLFGKSIEKIFLTE